MAGVIQSTSGRGTVTTVFDLSLITREAVAVGRLSKQNADPIMDRTGNFVPGN